MRRPPTFYPRLFAILIATALLHLHSPAAAQEPELEGVWIEERPPGGPITQTMRLTLHPQAEPQPPLKYRLLPRESQMLDGNAAIHYLKAMGFLEQQAAQKRLQEIITESMERVRQERKDIDEVPPYSWQSTRPEELPLEEVKEFLKLTSFQLWPLEEAAQRRRADFDRQLQEQDEIWAYLIPEIQSMRELARLQRLRCRVAIAEGDTEQALKILGQQYAMARHLGQDEFVISALVGVSVGGVAWEDALHLIRQPNAPNLYWAFAALPRPVVDIQHELDTEAEWLPIGVKVLREVDETPRQAGYWQGFIDRLIPQLGSLEAELAKFGVRLPDDPVAARATFAGLIAAAYPGAKQYLIDRGQLDRERIEEYPTAQVFFLALLRYHEERQQEAIKWAHLPYWQAKPHLDDFAETVRAQEEQIGWTALPTELISVPIVSVLQAVARMQQQIALMQTIEAIRMAGAVNGGKLPQRLEDLPLPAPVDPFTGRPFDYQHLGSHAVLSGAAHPHLQYRFVLRFDPEDSSAATR
ncbi:hypothetical protein [Candidatus Laterigemmans baculatus]|uniref:hypothetical protein n=1 Tax=Candidatus Laterigemmans baculatus TaxID=2770505 RepID=UPI0013D92AAD|nr:hypothetical protein [Candidatus Laterigemmans baculatus]